MLWKSTEFIAFFCVITFAIRLAFLSQYVCDLGLCPKSSLWETLTSVFATSPNLDGFENMDERDIPLYLFYHDKNGNAVRPPPKAAKLMAASVRKRAIALVDLANYQMEELLITMDSMSEAFREYEGLTGQPLRL